MQFPPVGRRFLFDDIFAAPRFTRIIVDADEGVLLIRHKFQLNVAAAAASSTADIIINNVRTRVLLLLLVGRPFSPSSEKRRRKLLVICITRSRRSHSTHVVCRNKLQCLCGATKYTLNSDDHIRIYIYKYTRIVFSAGRPSFEKSPYWLPENRLSSARRRLLYVCTRKRRPGNACARGPHSTPKSHRFD